MANVTYRGKTITFPDDMSAEEISAAMPSVADQIDATLSELESSQADVKSNEPSLIDNAKGLLAKSFSDVASMPIDALKNLAPEQPKMDKYEPSQPSTETNSAFELAQQPTENLLNKAKTDARLADEYANTLRAPAQPVANLVNIVKGVALSLPQGAETTRQGIRTQFADAIGSESMRKDAQLKAKRNSLEIESTTPAFETETAQGLYSGATSLIQQIPGLVAAIATGNPVPALANAGLMTEAEAYSRYRERGATPQEAITGAMGEGITEVLTEMMPMGFLVKKFGKTGAGEIVSGFIARDAIPEQVATLTQDAIDTAIANPDKTWGEYLEERPSAAYQTLLATVVQGGAIGGANYVAQKMSGDRLIVGNQDTANQDDLRAQELQAQYDAKVAQEKAQQAEADEALVNITNPNTTVDEAIDLAKKAVDVPVNTQSDDALLQEIQAATREALPASDILEDDNVSDIEQGNTPLLDSGSIGTEFNNGIGSAIDTVSQFNDTLGSGPSLATIPNEGRASAEQLRGAEAGNVGEADLPASVDATQEQGVKEVNVKEKKKYNAGSTLQQKLAGLGGISFSDLQDITGEKTKSNLKSYTNAFKTKSNKSLKGIIESGDLDEFLPPAMRLETNGMNDEAFDSTEAYDYLSERIRNGEKVLPYDIEQEAKMSEAYANESLQADINTTAEDDGLDLNIVKSMLKEAGYDEVDFLNESKDYETRNESSVSENEVAEQGSSNSDIASSERSEVGTPATEPTAGQTTARNEVAETPSGNERQGVRPFVESIVKRRAAANQINKSKAFDTYLTAAKDFLNGKEVSPSRFKLASKAFKNDAPLSEAFKGLEALAKQSRQSKNQTGNSYTDRIATAKTQAELQTLASEIQSDTTLTDKQAQDLDDAVMGRIDSFEVNATAANNVDDNKTESIDDKPAISKAETTAGNYSYQAQPKLKIDNPQGSWLDNKKKYSDEDGVNEYGVRKNMGSITGYFDEKVIVPVSKLSNLKGMRGEQNNVRKNDLDEIKKIMSDTGKLPLMDNGEEYAPFIRVDQDGTAWISEGNHRIIAAKELGWKELPIEIKYYNGGEDVKGDFSPDVLLGKQGNTDLLGDNTTAKQAIADAEREKDTKRNTGTDNYLDKQENKGMKSLWEGREPTSTATGKQSLFAADSDNKASQNNPNAKSQSDSVTVNSKQDDVNTAIEAIKADGTIPSAEKIRLTSELRQGKITPDDVKAVVGEAKASQGKIEDFGEKIGGAKKDLWASYQDKMESSLKENVAEVPLSKSWPEPNYQALIDDGADAMLVSFAHSMRDAVTTKPKSQWKVKNWASKVQALRDFSYDWIENKPDAVKIRNDIFSKASGFPELREVYDRAELYQKVGHEKSLKGIRVSSGSYTVYDGVKYDQPKRIWTVEKDSAVTSYSNWPRTLATGSTKEEAIDNFVKAFKDLEITPPASKQVSFDIYSYRRSSNKTWIGKKVGKNYIDLKEFDSTSEAREYLKNNYDELVAMLAKAKEIPNERNEENAPRVGADHRNGANITPQVFGETFGFRGVEFGNYVENDKRQQDLNEAYDAFMDMAGVLNIPPKALSLNGELGIAFGARGSGGKNPAKAHYESGHIVINMTKNKGAGSLGHEWWHGLDNYFSRMRGNKDTFTTEALDVDLASRGVTYRAQGEVRKEMIDAFGGVTKAIKASALKQRSGELDKRRTKDYWTTMLEMTARSFESYLISKLQDQNARNDYLANIVSEETWGADNSYPYPTAGELPAIRAAYDNFFNTVQTKETDEGNVVLFSRANEIDAPIFFSQLSKAIEGAKQDAMPATQWRLWLQSNAAKLGVKKDEIQWTGVTDWLELQGKEKVSKADIQAYLDGNGVSVEEVVLGDDEFNGLRVEESEDGETWTVLGSDDEIIGTGSTEQDAIDDAGISSLSEPTKYSQYTVEGGENYKELLLTLPIKGGNNDKFTPLPALPDGYTVTQDKMRSDGRTYAVIPPNQIHARPYNGYHETIEVAKSSALNYLNSQLESEFYDAQRGANENKAYRSTHFDQPNILAHVRFDERTDADGNKVLFINEIQSDWGQEGKKKGFNLNPKDKARHKELRKKWLDNTLTEAEGVEFDRLDESGIGRMGETPTAPFVTDTKAWVALAIKRMMRYAVDNGFDKVAFINGQQAADLYDLSKTVEKISKHKKSSMNYALNENESNIDIEIANAVINLAVNDTTGNITQQAGPNTLGNLVGKNIEDVVGKEVAKKLLESKGNKILSGIDLKVGGEGMRTFYDQIVPQVVNDVLKKVGGGKVENVTFEKAKPYIAESDSGEEIARFATLDEANSYRKENPNVTRVALSPRDNSNIGNQAGFTITPEMREKIASGLPLFRRDDPYFSLGTGTILTLTKSKSQFGAKILNKALVKYFGEDWSNSYESVDVPDTLSAYREEVKAAFGKELRYVSPTNEKFNIFAGVQLPKSKNAIYVNARAETNLTSIAGHELYHTLERTRPDIHKWFKEQAEQYIQDFGAYHENLNNKLKDGEKPYKSDAALSELLADFTGDALSDTNFLQTLANADGNKFKGLLNATIRFLNTAILKLKNLGSSKYISDVEALRDSLRKALLAFADGKPIVEPVNQTETEAFLNWFGDSKVVDEDGKPLVVYHGTDKSFTTFDSSKTMDSAFWFTSDRSALERGEVGAANSGDIIPVYLSAKKLAGWDEYERLGYDQLIRDGYDGIQLDNDFIVFEPNQIKSATGNNGNFDSNNDDIRFSRQGRLTPEWQSLDEESMMDDVIRSLQDKYVDLKRVTQKIKEANGDITDRFDAYLQEELYHGRTAKRVQDFINKDLKPLIDDMRMRSVGMADFEEYLWMRHAPERNEQIAKINEDMPDGGSGVTTAEAESYMQALSPADKKKYEALAKRIDAINKKSRQALIDYGLESPETIAAWEAAYENYVPLMREDMERGFGNGTGTGFKVKGNASKRAMGSNRAVVDIIGNIAQQFEKNVIRGEKNRVATALVGLAKLNPKDGFWSVDTPPTIRHVSKATGLVEMRTDPNYKNRESVVVARIPDKNGRIQERSVVFDEFDDRAMKLARSINNLDVDKVSKVTNFMGSITRYFSSINTQYNPIFGVVNITRDVQGALLNLTTTEIAGKQKDVLKNVLPALRGIYGATRTETGVNNPLQFAFTKKQKAEAQKMRELWEEYQREGGTTGFRDMYANAEERTKAISKALDPQWWTKTLAGKVVTLNGVLTVPESVLKDKAIKPVFDWLSDYNQTLENAVRLAAYKTAIEQGISKQRAASIGKNISVNFNRKGSSTRFMGSLYAFYNAAVQGTARIGETLTGPKGKQIIAGGIGIGAMQAIMLHMMGFDEEEPPEFVRANNFIIPMPTSDKGYVTIPMPLGFNVLPNFGRIATEWTLSGAENTTERVIDMFGAVMESFNPLGGNGRLDSMYTPTALDPFNDLSKNEDWAGRPIAQEDFSGSKPTPGYTRTRDKTWSGYTEVARWINNLSDGDDYEQGRYSPTGDQIDYLVGQLTGGVGREISKSATTVEAIATGEDLPMYKIPLVGRFYGQTKGQAPQSTKFYNNLIKINKIDYAVKERYEAGEDYREYIEENPEFALVEFGKKAYSAIQKARKYKSQLVEEGASREKVKEIDETITGYMMQFNDEMAKIKESATSP